MIRSLGQAGDQSHPIDSVLGLPPVASPPTLTYYLGLMATLALVAFVALHMPGIVVGSKKLLWMPKYL